MKATEQAVDATMDKVGIPSGKVGLWSVGQTSSYMVICADFFNY